MTDGGRSDPEPVKPPPTLFWLYGLVAAGLFGIGVAAGNVFFLGQRSLLDAFGVAVTQCEREHLNWATDNSAFDALNDCMRGPEAIWGLVVLAGAVLVLTGAIALMVVLPLVDRWRSRWRHNRLEIVGAQERFDALCDHSGLYGRRRPGLFVAGPPVRQAFTTALPGRRAIVVLPAAVALSHADGRRFDPIVQHELAHVLARDVTWVSALRGLLWIAVPAVVVASIPDLLAVRAVTQVPATAFVEILVMVVAVAALAAALLRRREHEADRYAANSGSASALAELLAGAAERPRRRGDTLRRILANHPDPPARIAALPDPGQPRPDRSAWSDLAQAAAFGFVTVTLMGATYTLTMLLDYPASGWLAPLLGCVVGGVLLGGGATPSLHRRALAWSRTGQAGGWWPWLLGIVVGVVAGMFVSPVVSVPGQTPFLFTAGGIGTILAVVVFAAAASGAIAVCAGLAVLMSTRPATRPMRSMTYVAGAAAAFAAFWPLTSVASVLTSPAGLRIWLVYGPSSEGWPLLFAAVPLAAAILLYRRHSNMELARAALVGGFAFVLASIAGLVRSHLTTANTTDLGSALYQERAWICALAGWLVLLIVAGRGGTSSLAIAVVTAFSVTVASWAVQLVDDGLAGRSDSLLDRRLSVITPGVWLSWLILLTAPVLILLARPVTSPAVAAATVAADQTATNVRRSRRLIAPALAAVSVAGVAALVVGVGLPMGYVRPGEPVAVSPGPPGATLGVSATASATPAVPGKDLSDEEAHAVAASVGAVLPAYWKPTPPAPQTSGDSTYEPASCVHIATNDYIDALEPDQRAAGEADFETVSTLSSINSLSLTVWVYAYGISVPGSLFTAAEGALAACAHLSTKTTTGVMTIDYEASPAPSFGEQSWRVIEHVAVRSGGTVIRGTASLTLASVGNCLVVVHEIAVVEDLDEALADQAMTAALATLRTMTASR